jgi:hypothetical protein
MFSNAKTIPAAIILGIIIWGKGEVIMLIGSGLWDVVSNPYVEMNFNADDNKIITSRVIAMVNNQTFVGYASGDIDGKGLIKIRSTQNNKIECIGSFEYVSRKLLSGKGVINCNDGAEATFSFQGRDQVSGEGYGASNLGSVYFTYGYSPQESSKFINKSVQYIEKYY